MFHKQQLQGHVAMWQFIINKQTS